MCGIFCLIKKEKLSESDINFCRKKTKEQFHRGPNNYGEWKNDNIFIGHQRLSINDVSHKANQPFVKNNKVLVFNGEVYNFKDLKKNPKLDKYKFETSSDTEVFFYLLLEYGSNALNFVNGMFAFVFFDGENLIIGNDCFAEKTLYYLKQNNSIYISSELNSLSAIDEKDFKKEKLYSFLTFGHLIKGDTFYKKIKKLNPSQLLIVDKNTNIKKEEYFNIKNYYLKNKSKKNIENKDFEELFNILEKNIVEKNLSDVNNALLLSSGIDSRLVCSLLSKNNKKIETITYLNKYEDMDILNEFIQNKKIKNIQIPSIDLADESSNIINLFGQPHNSYTALAIKQICKNLKSKNIKVAITGLGADELFFGYNKFYDYKKLKFKIKKLIKFNFKEEDLSLLVKSKNLFEFKTDKNYEEWINNNFEREKHFSAVENMYFDELNLYLPNSRCVVSDVAAMSESIELRSSFLDHEVLKWLLKFDLNEIHKLGRKNIIHKFTKKIENNMIIPNKKIAFSTNYDHEYLKKNIHIRNMFNEIFPNLKFNSSLQTAFNLKGLEMLNYFKH